MKNLIVVTALCFSFSSTAFAQAATSAPAPAAAVAAPAAAAPAAAVPAVPAVAVAPAAPLIAPPPANTIPYVQMVLNYVESIPAAGKILSIIFQILAILGVAGTALIAILMAIQSVFVAAGKAVWAPLGVAADWIQAVLPWVKYLSLYKPAAPPAPEAVAVKKV